MAVNHGDIRGEVAIRTAWEITSGSVTDHSKAWNPPIELPTIRSILPIPNSFLTRIEAAIVSLIVTFGKSK